ncbi:MAG: RDD family protein [Fibrobacteraceae bacterium]
MKWFYIDESIVSGERRVGPLTTEEIKSLQGEGKLAETTLVWHKGLTQWVPYSEAFAQWKKEQDQVNELLESTLATIIKEKELSPKNYAGFWVRGAAIIIDFVLLSIFGTIVATIQNAMGLMDLNGMQTLIDAYYQNPLSVDASQKIFDAPGVHLFLIICFIIQSAYSIFFHARYSGTLGKKLLHLRVEKADGSKLGLRGAIVRYLFSLLTQATFIFYGVGYLLAAIDPQKRALHDFFAKTRVVHSDVTAE